MSSRRRILEEWVYKGKTPEEVRAVAPLCKAIAQEVMQSEATSTDPPSIKEAFWHCMVGQMRGEPVDETIARLKAKLRRGEL